MEDLTYSSPSFHLVSYAVNALTKKCSELSEVKCSVV